MMKRIIKATEKKVENEPVKMDATFGDLPARNATYQTRSRGYQRGPAGQTSADAQGGHLRQRRQWHHRHHQRRATPECREAGFQLVTQSRRARTARKNRAATDAPPRYRHKRFGRPSGERR